MKPKKANRSPVGYLIFSFVLYLLWGGGAGFLIAFTLDRKEPLLWLLAIALLVGIFFLQLILHEAGHLLFGLATGYRFTSFRVGSVIWVNTGQGLRRGTYSLAGTAGQCLMAPPPFRTGHFPVLLYNLGGSLVNLFTALVFGGLSLVFAPATFGWLFCCLMALTGLVDALQNGIPISAGVVANDGYNAFFLGKKPAARRAFWLQLSIMGQMARGIRLKDMPEDWFASPPQEDMGDPLTAAIAVLACNRLMDQHSFSQAAQAIETCLDGDNGVLGLHQFMLHCDLVCCRLLAGDGPGAAQVLDDPQYKKLAKGMKNYPSVLRTQYFRALLAEGDQEKASGILAKFESVARTFPYPGEIAGEREFMALAQHQKEALL